MLFAASSFLLGAVVVFLGAVVVFGFFDGTFTLRRATLLFVRFEVAFFLAITSLPWLQFSSL
jgi:hypothetical protein